VSVQQQLHRVEEWKLADLKRRLERLQASERELISALNDDSVLQGLFIDAMARRLRGLSEETARVKGEMDVQSARLLEQAARKVCAERLAMAVDRQVLRSNDKNLVLDAIEQFVAAAAQASGKITDG
jgi:hypothetical protein